MYKYHIKIEYDGSQFVGWQFQKNGISIQEILQKAISRYLKEKIKVIGSGRTDAGVHAVEQSAHFEIKNKIQDEAVFLNSINFSLSRYLVSVLDIKKRNKKFHARFSAKKRIYRYIIINRRAPIALKKIEYGIYKKI